MKQQIIDTILEEDAAAVGGLEVSEVEAEDSVDWMTQVLQSDLFSKIPADNIQQIFSLFESLTVKAGDAIINQGESGDYFYIIKTGRCEVSRKPSASAKGIKLARLGEEESFGEEALIGNTQRNATVRMVTDGTLMRLKKDDFVSLIKDPALEFIALQQAQDLVSQGAVWLDVRFPKEYEHDALDESINLPINMLRIGAAKLDPNKHYIVYCEDGTRSSIASFLLSQCDLKVSCLDGGLIAQGILKSVDNSSSAVKINADTQCKNVSEDLLPASEDVPGTRTIKDAEPSQNIAEKVGAAIDTDMDALTSALGSVLKNVYQQLEQALKEKEEAEAARKKAEKKLEELLQNQK